MLLDNMQIELQLVRPVFMEPGAMAGSEVWGQGITLTPGEQVQVIAPSGSGKTSLVHFLYGLRKDFSGRILYDGKDISLFNAEDFAVLRQQQAGVVFQDMRLFANHTVYENINIKRVLAPFHPEAKIGEMASRLGIGSKLNKLVSTCSYGEQQRAAIIRALMQPFSFLLLDEPFSHLDENNRHIAMGLITEEAHARGASVLLADLKRIDYFSATRILNL